jgi:hypothetical protein
LVGSIGRFMTDSNTRFFRRRRPNCLKKIVTREGKRWRSKPSVASKGDVTRKDAF